MPLKLLYPLSKYPDFLSVLGSKEVGDIVDSLLPSGRFGPHLGRRPDQNAFGGRRGRPPSGYWVGPGQIQRPQPGHLPAPGWRQSCLFSSRKPSPRAVDRHRGRRHRAGMRRIGSGPSVTQPGDIVIHNVHVLHYSEPNLSQHPRATWYLEFRSMRDLLEKGPWNPDWAHRRRAIWVYARAEAGVDISQDEPDEVKKHLEGLRREYPPSEFLTQPIRSNMTGPALQPLCLLERGLEGQPAGP